jgi:hypothetical protein
MGPDDCTNARLDDPCGERTGYDDYDEIEGSVLGFEERE